MTTSQGVDCIRDSTSRSGYRAIEALVDRDGLLSFRTQTKACTIGRF